jgi:tetratricopeptide (TPR) repeat protein
VLCKRHDFLEQAAFPLQVALDALAWMAPGVEAFLIHGLQAEQAQHARVDLAGKRLHHAAILVLEERAHRRGEHEDGLAGVTEDQHLHLPAEQIGMPGTVVAVHRGMVRQVRRVRQVLWSPVRRVDGGTSGTLGRMSRWWRRWTLSSACCGALMAGAVLSAMPIIFETENVPVDRVAANLERMIAEKPQDVGLRLNLARTHAMAFAQKLDALRVAKRGGLPFFGDEFGYRNVSVLPPKDQAAAAAAEAQLKAAIAAYRDLLKIDPNHSVGNLGLGWCLKLAGDREGAKTALRKTIAIEWPIEKERRSTWGSMVLEAWAHLRPLLDPVADAAELRTMAEHQAVISKQGRMITPIAVPLRARLDARDIADDRAAVLFDADGSGIPKRWTWITDEAAWLVFDRKDTRTVTSALQLFGSVTFWLFWENGYDRAASAGRQRRRRDSRAGAERICAMARP